MRHVKPSDRPCPVGRLARLLLIAALLTAHAAYASAPAQTTRTQHSGAAALHSVAKPVATAQRAKHLSARAPAARGVKPVGPSVASTKPSPEARLLEVFRLIGHERLKEALAKASALVADVPNFQLAQLTYADLLLAQASPLPTFGAAPVVQHIENPQQERLGQLRDEAVQRLAALRERPPAGAIPRQFIELPRSTQHAIAVDASRSRLYLFENTASGLKLVDDHYASLGRLGTDKAIVGDQRTPLGVYFITNRLEGWQLADFYGTGALPLNYPNEYDRKLGKTGSGIWLHGVPSDSYARSPHSTDGCVALSNEDLRGLMAKVKPRTTPVLIAAKLDWVQPQTIDPEKLSIRNLIEGWRGARITGDINRALSFYSTQFSNGAPDSSDWKRQLQRDISQIHGRRTQIKELSILAWQDKSPLMVVTFGEVVEGERTGPLRRQYWTKEGGLWKIFYEGVIG